MFVLIYMQLCSGHYRFGPLHFEKMRKTCNYM
uniref:Uncharacterized protein n=1 Tax=Rhizophora mucronata TaxID=61149 RepID=A0A2P2P8N4_RHIMU